MTPVSPGPDRLRLLAATLHESIEVEYDDSAGTWALGWTDGPTVAQMRRAAEAAEPEVVLGVRYLRRYSEDAVALGAVRLAVATSADDARRRPEISPAAVEALWRDVPDPGPATERERSLVYALVYEIHDAHHRNHASAHQVCDMVARYGLAPLLRRISAELTPIETLTAHYAPTHAHPAWHYRLAPMSAAEAFEAVRHDPNATRDLIEAALTLLPELPDIYAGADAHLRARLHQSRNPQL